MLIVNYHSYTSKGHVTHQWIVCQTNGDVSATRLKLHILPNILSVALQCIPVQKQTFTVRDPIVKFRGQVLQWPKIATQYYTLYIAAYTPIHFAPCPLFQIHLNWIEREKIDNCHQFVIWHTLSFKSNETTTIDYTISFIPKRFRLNVYKAEGVI